jgi:hypothetical protein
VHIVFTAHENDPITESDGAGKRSRKEIRMSLGGQLINNVSSQIGDMEPPTGTGR